jgi:pimeloyl-ACP methyl ester carboxylesterase
MGLKNGPLEGWRAVPAPAPFPVAANAMPRINGHFLYLEIHGPAIGPPVVLLHHGLGTVRAWKEQVPALAQSGYRVIAYDRWGYGRSDPRDQLSIPYFKEDQADLSGLLDDLGVQRAVLIGHSDGGTLALYWAARQASRVAALVVSGAHIYVEAGMLPGLEGLRQTYEQDDDFRARLERRHPGKAGAVFSNWYTGWRAAGSLDWDLRPLLRQVTCPALVIQGLEDEHASPEHARDLASALPAAELWLAAGVGHMLPQDIPEEFNSRVLTFLDQQIEGKG